MTTYEKAERIINSPWPYISFFGDGSKHKGEIAGNYNTLKSARKDAKERNLKIMKVGE